MVPMLEKGKKKTFCLTDLCTALIFQHYACSENQNWLGFQAIKWPGHV